MFQNTRQAAHTLPITSTSSGPIQESKRLLPRKIAIVLTPLILLCFVISRQFTTAEIEAHANEYKNTKVDNNASPSSSTTERHQVSSIPLSILPEANVPTDSFHIGEEHANPIHKPIVISGPSGVGKGTLINMIVEFYHDQKDTGLVVPAGEHHDMDDLFGFSVSHTTRKPRPGEIDGVHYHFTTREKMEREIEDGSFIEHAEVHGNLYGTSYQAVRSVSSSGRICILDIDIQGAKRMKESTSKDENANNVPYFIFIKPPSMELLEKRLRDRGTETEEAIVKRLGNAAREIEFGTAVGNFDEVVVNDELESAFLRLRLILEEWFPHLNQVPSKLM